MGSNKRNQSSKPAKKPLKRPEKRVLVRWNDELDRKLLLSIQSACNTLGLRIPWDKVADLMGPSVSEGAIIQHLAKLRTRMKEFKLPPLRRGGAPTQFAKPPEAADDNKRSTRSKKQTQDNPENQDYIFDGAYYSEFMDEDDEEESDYGDGHVEKRAKTASSATYPKRGAPRAGPSNMAGNCSDDEYVDDADEGVSQAASKVNDDRSTPSSQGYPMIGLGEEYLNFGNISSTSGIKGPSNLSEISEHQDPSKMVKLVMPPKKNPEDGSAGYNTGAPQKTHWKNGSEQVMGGDMNKWGFAVNNVPSLYRGQGMFTGHNEMVGAPSPLVPPAPGTISPHQIQHGMNTIGNNAFSPFGSTPSMPSAQHTAGFGGDSFGIQAVRGPAPGVSYGEALPGTSFGASTPGTLHGSLSSGTSYGGSLPGGSYSTATSGHSFASYGVAGVTQNEGGGPAIPGFDGHNSYSSNSGRFADNATPGMTSNATTDSINPATLDNSNSLLGQVGPSQSGLQSTLFNSNCDGMPMFDPPTGAYMSLTDNTPSALGLDNSSFAEEYLNYFTSGDLEGQAEIDASDDIFEEWP